MTVAAVRLWGRRIGAVAIGSGETAAVFEYDPDFARSGIEISPLTLPLRPGRRSFPELPRETFHGLPGLLADSLPDRFGAALITAWLNAEGREAGSFDAVERLCYLGTRGLGALEFAPATGPAAPRGAPLEIGGLVRLASLVLSRKSALAGSLADGESSAALQQILLVGTSAGGARAKAVIAWNPTTNDVRSGQADAGPGFEHWLLKFDGVEDDRGQELSSPRGYGAIELAYARMAIAAGIAMAECRILEEGGRRHFMTRRFDRTATGAKVHMQTLGSLAHFDYNQAGAHSYEQALLVIRQLGLGMEAREEQFRRMAFNVIARNQDDHVKNISFLMSQDGRWTLSPAYDLTYANTPANRWIGQHQMTVNGKRDDFEVADFRSVAAAASLRRGRAEGILAEVRDAVLGWREHAHAAGVGEQRAEQIAAAHRLALR